MTLFTKGVVHRVQALEGTVERLAQGQPLLAPPTGYDEIGRAGRRVVEVAEMLQAREFALAGSLNVLEQRTRELEATTAEQESFIYTVSHDLRAPLVSIQGLATAVVEDHEGDLPGDARHYLDRIVANADKMQAFISDLLELARVGRIETEQTPVDLNRVVQGATDSLAATLERRGVTVRVAHLPTVSANEARMSQLFTNLIDNAVKYTPDEREPAIAIGAIDRGDVWEIAVEDNGVGIPAELHDKVFGLFQRLPAGKTLNPRGSGVGLAIVARIVATHGGHLWLESADGVGTTFHLTLPKGQVQREEDTDASPAESTGEPVTDRTVVSL